MNKPNPKDFPPESPHDLEWGGYSHKKYQAALESWERQREYRLGVAIGYDFVDEMFSTVERGGEAAISGAVIRSMKWWDKEPELCEREVNNWLMALHKQYNISSVYDKSTDMIYFRKSFIFRDSRVSYDWAKD